VSVEAGKWGHAFRELGCEVVTVAGDGPVDRRVPGLGLDAGDTDGPHPGELAAALADADLVVVENVCSLPLNRAAADAVAAALRGRAAILHHHDLPWQRPQFGPDTDLPDDPAWAHVTINDLSRRQLAERGITATTIHNCFDVDVAAGDRERTRRVLGVGTGERLLLHPTRAIPRKNVPGAVTLAATLGATYWLLGPAEDGYGPDLERILARALVPVRRGLPAELDLADAYAGCDAVTLPSTWEGFGNATVESAVHRRPLAIGDYPVADEIAAYGFGWFPAADAGPLDAWLDEPATDLLDHNQAVARRHLSLDRLRRHLADLLRVRGWAP